MYIACKTTFSVKVAAVTKTKKEKIRNLKTHIPFCLKNSVNAPVLLVKSALS